MVVLVTKALKTSASVLLFAANVVLVFTSHLWHQRSSFTVCNLEWLTEQLLLFPCTLLYLLD
jgi:hypothetical protein